MKMTLTPEEVRDLLEHEIAKEVDVFPSKWGTTHVFVFERDNKHWMFRLDHEPQEGYVTLKYETVEATQVEPVEKTVIQWRAVKETL